MNDHSEYYFQTLCKLLNKLLVRYTGGTKIPDKKYLILQFLQILRSRPRSTPQSTHRATVVNLKL